MFAHYGVTSPTAFKHLFYTIRLPPPGDPCTMPTPPPPRHLQHTPAWHWLRTAHGVYAGQVLYGMPHGLGWQCVRSTTGVTQYWGHFAHGRYEGLGVLLNERGDKCEAQFRHGAAWGPGGVVVGCVTWVFSCMHIMGENYTAACAYQHVLISCS